MKLFTVKYEKKHFHLKHLLKAVNNFIAIWESVGTQTFTFARKTCSFFSGRNLTYKVKINKSFKRITYVILN